METYQVLVLVAAVLAYAVGWVMSHWWTKSEILKAAAAHGYFVGTDGCVYKCLPGEVIINDKATITEIRVHAIGEGQEE